jgi:hypothetical protein
MISLRKSKALLVHLFLNSHLLTFLSKDIIFDPGIRVLVWLGAGDRFESWDFCLSHLLITWKIIVLMQLKRLVLSACHFCLH